MTEMSVTVVKIQVRRGPEAAIPQLDVGEPAITTDTKKIFIGTSSGNKQLASLDDLDGVANQLSQKVSTVNGVSPDVNGDVKVDVVVSGDYTKLTNKPNLSTVATSGKYSDLTGTPKLSTVASTGSYNDLTSKPNLSTVASTGSYTDLSHQPTLSNVATSGSYADLVDKPSLSTVATSGDYNDLKNQPAPYALPVASSTTVGGIKIGYGLSTDASGLVSVDTQNVVGILAFDTTSDYTTAYPNGLNIPVWIRSTSSWYYWEGTSTSNLVGTATVGYATVG